MPTKAMQAALDALWATAAAEPSSAAPLQGADRKMPDSLLEALGNDFVGVYYRQAFHSLDVSECPVKAILFTHTPKAPA